MRSWSASNKAFDAFAVALARFICCRTFFISQDWFPLSHFPISHEFVFAFMFIFYCCHLPLLVFVLQCGAQLCSEVMVCEITDITRGERCPSSHLTSISCALPVQLPTHPLFISLDFFLSPSSFSPSLSTASISFHFFHQQHNRTLQQDPNAKVCCFVCV